MSPRQAAASGPSTLEARKDIGAPGADNSNAERPDAPAALENEVALDPRALAAAAEWLLLSRLLEPPDEGWADEVAGLARNVEDELLSAAASAAAEGASEPEYWSILGPGAVSPREVGHLGFGPDPGHVASELQAYYQAFGYHPQSREAYDHVSVEAGFVGFLKLKEAFARASRDTQAAETTAQAARDFILEHLARLGEPLRARLDGVEPRYLAIAARALAQRTGPSPARPLPAGADAELAAGCGLTCAEG